MNVSQAIIELVERFEENLASYTSGTYNEAQLRREFIDPLFRALGWDLDNVAGHAEAYKDVIHEDAIRIGGAVKAPDYCFRIGGTRKFFVEAKKPAVRIAEEAAPAYQLRRIDSRWTSPSTTRRSKRSFRGSITPIPRMSSPSFPPTSSAGYTSSSSARSSALPPATRRRWKTSRR